MEKTIFDPSLIWLKQWMERCEGEKDFVVQRDLEISELQRNFGTALKPRWAAL